VLCHPKAAASGARSCDADRGFLVVEAAAARVAPTTLRGSSHHHYPEIVAVTLALTRSSLIVIHGEEDSIEESFSLAEITLSSSPDDPTCLRLAADAPPAEVTDPKDRVKQFLENAAGGHCNISDIDGTDCEEDGGGGLGPVSATTAVAPAAPDPVQEERRKLLFYVSPALRPVLLGHVEAAKRLLRHKAFDLELPKSG